jgi:hypothetical protein
MTPDQLNKWETLIEEVEKSKIPIQCIKKLVLKLNGKRQHTINIEKLLNQGLDLEQLEEVVSKKLSTFNEDILSVEFMLDIESIAKLVQPETDKLLSNL